MEQKMAQGAGLSFRQKQFLDLVLQEKYILKNFYLSGGTALSSWYLHHRESYDLDFFSDQPFDGDRIAYWIKQNQENLGYQALTVDDDFGFYTFFFRYPDNSRFKIDFNRYSPSRLQKGLVWQGLEIDSLYDIAVNKAQAIRTHPRERDYVDLYIIIRETNWKIYRLFSAADKKFEITTDNLQIAKHFLKATELNNIPKMLVPFSPKAMEKFYLDLAKSLKKEIFTY